MEQVDAWKMKLIVNLKERPLRLFQKDFNLTFSTPDDVTAERRWKSFDKTLHMFISQLSDGELEILKERYLQISKTSSL